MKKWMILVLVMACVAMAQAQSSGLLSPNQKTPKEELAQIEAQIASAKTAGSVIDPALVARMKELLPLVKGHPGNVKLDASAAPNTYRTLEQDGFGTPTVLRAQELSPLEQQIQELERQLLRGLGQQVDDVTFMTIKLQLNELYAQRSINRERNPLDQGADVCPGTVVTGVPYTDSGTTVGLGDNYAEDPAATCPNYSGAPEVVYAFTPTATQTYTINTEGSSYDTYLYINTGGGCPGTTHIACDDDNGTGLLSSITVLLNAGQPYYIFVDGFSTNAGAYVLNILGNCEVECLATDIFECAGEYPGPGNEATDCNGGCDPTFYGGVESWQEIQPCQAICGRGFTYLGQSGGNSRDVDGYRLTLTEACSLDVTVRAEFASQVYVTAGSCPWNILYISPSWSYACSTVTFRTPCFQPGTYSVLILPSVYTGINAPSEYRARVDLVPCSGCRIDAFLQAPGNAAWNTCGAGNNNSLRGSEDYTYCVNIPFDSDWSFSTCNDDSIWDSYMYLSTQCNGGVLAQDDDACGGVGLSVINCVYLTAGTYYLTIEGFSDSGCGPFVLNVTECVGSCCYGDPGSPACEFVRLSYCSELGGVFTYAEPCSTGACYTRPTCNDDLSLYSQLPGLPDEDWNANVSDLEGGYRQYEDYLVSEDIGTVKFWGVFVGDPTCSTSPHDFEITFIDSVNNLTQTYNVTLTGTVLPAVYFGFYQLVEFTASLPTACTIQSGYVRIVEYNSPGCTFYWSWTVLGNGIGAFENVIGGATYPTARELAFCLGKVCPPADSVTVELYPNVADAYTLRWWQPEGNVTLWYSTSPNAVFPATYNVLAGGYLGEGSYDYSFYTPDFAAYEMIFVLTIDCAPLLTAPEAGDLPLQVISSPFGPPAPAQR